MLGGMSVLDYIYYKCEKFHFKDITMSIFSIILGPCIFSLNLLEIKFNRNGLKQKLYANLHLFHGPRHAGYVPCVNRGQSFTHNIHHIVISAI